MSWVELVANPHCETGEHPLWIAERHELLWTDIPRGRLYALDELTGRLEIRYKADPVGGFTLQADGSLVLFRVHDVVRLSDAGRVSPIAEYLDPGASRFNDVIADPEGRVFAGTMGRNGEPTGGLVRLDRDGHITPLFTGTAIANGMAFSPDFTTFYWTDTTARTIVAFDYDRMSGSLRRRRVLVEVPAGQGVPDGLAADERGCLWSARWDGAAVYRYSPDGDDLDRIMLPVAKVSAVAFGGPDLRTMYITTGGGNGRGPGMDGAVFRVRVETPGLPRPRSRIGL